jgi:hypothetical protein
MVVLETTINMGKKSKADIEFLGSYDSKEEVYFSWYLDDLKKHGFVTDYKHEPKSFTLFDKVEYEWEQQLKTKTKTKTSTLIREHSYTPDFMVVWTDLGKNILHGGNPKEGIIISNNNVSWVDVKGSWDMQNMTRLFTINQKWMYAKHGIYVNKVIPDDLFRKTFTPTRYFTTDKSETRRRAIRFNAITIQEYKIRNHIQ